MDQQADSLEARIKDVLKVGGLAALAIAVVTAATADAALAAIVTAFSDGSIPELDLEGFALIVNVWVFTAPLAITVGILGLAYAHGLANDSGSVQLAAVATAVVLGFLLGNIVYSALLDTTLVLNLESLIEAVSRQQGGWQYRVGAGIGWFVQGYAELFGWPYFVAAVIAGAFTAFAIYWPTRTKSDAAR